MQVTPLRSSLCAEDAQHQLSVLALQLWEQGPAASPGQDLLPQTVTQMGLWGRGCSRMSNWDHSSLLLDLMLLLKLSNIHQNSLSSVIFHVSAFTTALPMQN